MAEPSPSIAYDTHAAQRAPASPEWRLLRMIAILWSAAVLYRHGTYWTGQLLERRAMISAFRAGTGSLGALWESLPGNPSETLAEVIVLFTTLVLAIRSRVETRRAARGLQILGLGFIVLVLADFFLNRSFAIDKSQGIFRAAIEITWQLVSKLQLLIVPFAMSVGLKRFRR